MWFAAYTSLHKLFQWRYRPIVGGNLLHALLWFPCENFYFHSRNWRLSHDNNVCVFHIGKWHNSDAITLLLECRYKEQTRSQEDKIV